MKVAERFLAAKSGSDAECEDGIVITDDFAAVIDGATDKTGSRYDGMTGGRYAMLACTDALQSLSRGADAPAAVAHLTAGLAQRLPSVLEPQERPTAVLAVYSRARQEVWQIGDVGYWHPGLADGGVRPVKKLDRYAAHMRRAVLLAELANGVAPATLAAEDPGRHAILGLLTHGIFCNNAGAGEWAYAAVDGREVPMGLVAVHCVPDGVTDLVLASDGYPRCLPTLARSEDLLAELLAQDPLCIGVLEGTKGVLPGNYSFDDRAYLRLVI